MRCSVDTQCFFLRNLKKDMKLFQQSIIPGKCIESLRDHIILSEYDGMEFVFMVGIFGFHCHQ